MYSHRHLLGARPPYAPRSRSSVNGAIEFSSNANLKPVHPPKNNKQRYDGYGTIVPPNAMTVKSNDLCVVSP